MVRGNGLTVVLVLTVACGSSGPGTSADAGFDARVVDGATDGATDGAVDAGFDAALLDGRACVRDSDCGPPAAGRACEPNGVCGPASCYHARGHACPESLWCVTSHCVLPSCDTCPDGMVCSAARGECVAPVEPVACRASGGFYVRGRCLHPGDGEAACEGGFGAELISGRCDAPLVPGRTVGGALREGAFPIARVAGPVSGTLAAYRVVDFPTRWSRWTFAYVDGTDAMMVGLSAHSFVVDHRAFGCVTPSESPTRLCAALSLDSAFACDGLRVEAIAVEPEDFDEQHRMALAGRDDMGRLHVEVFAGDNGRFALSQTYTSAAPSRVWRPLAFAFQRPSTLWFRMGLAPPLTLVRLDSRDPVRQWPGAALAGGEELVAWDSRRAFARADSGGLLGFSTEAGVEVQTLLPASETPVGRYFGFDDGLGSGTLVGHASLPLPSTVERYDVSAESTGSVSIMHASEQPNIGLDVGGAFAAPQPDGSYLVQGRTRGGSAGVYTILGPEDVGGEILSVSDLVQSFQPESCGLDSQPSVFVLIGAVLEIRLADGSVVRELWAAGVRS